MSDFNPKTETELAELIGSFYADPYGWVMAAFPWGEKGPLPDGTENPLAEKTGPEPWQEEELKALGEFIRNNIILTAIGLEAEVWKSAYASGHGVGKSAFVAWLILFFMSTRVNTRGVVTASTQFQLEDKTWPELSKWHNLFICRHWFKWTSTALVFAKYPEERQKNYKTTAATVSEEKTEAFAGLHNEGLTVFIIFDEASGVIPKIWEVAEGALLGKGDKYFFALGNPTRADGEFADCFDVHANLYRTRNIDSREVSQTNRAAVEQLAQKYGEDSDEFKVRVRGQFPDQSFNGFISHDVVKAAQEREVYGDSGAALIMAVDVARFGSDKSCIRFRQGRDARSFPVLTFSKLSITRLADIVMKEADRRRPDIIVVEGTGMGAGLIDILRDRGYKVAEVAPGAAAENHTAYVNRRAEYWDAMKQWLAEEGCINADEEKLETQLTSILYSYDRHEQRIKLEAKEDMKNRGLESPDEGDTLALTFAVSVARRDHNLAHAARQAHMSITEYDVYNYGG